jgi:hypothetical protein
MPALLADLNYYQANGFPMKQLTAEDVTALLGRASRLIRGEFTDIDTRILAGEIDEQLVADIACEIVVAAMPVGDAFGVDSVQKGAGPFQTTQKFTNPRGDVYLSARHRRLLAARVPRRAFTIRTGGGS